MNFAQNEFAADGRAALALTAVMLKRLFPEVFSGVMLEAILDEAKATLPQGPGRTDVEARRLIDEVSKELGLAPRK